MTLFSVIADVHLANHKQFGGPRTSGLNARARYICRALEHVCKGLGPASELIVAGDLFDRSEPSPALVRAVFDTLYLGTENHEEYVHLLLGNHDMHSGDEHALLSLFNNFNVVDSAYYADGLLMVPFNTGPASEWLPVAIQEAKEKWGEIDLLVTHVGISRPEDPPFLRGADDAIDGELLDVLCADARIPCAIAGNWHKHRSWHGSSGTLLVQCGALVPTGFDNPGFDGYGTVCTWHTNAEKLTVVEVPGPRFIKAKDLYDFESQLIASGKDMHDAVNSPVFLRLEEPVGEGELPGCVVSCTVQPKGAPLTGRAEPAKQVMPSLESAVASFVEGMGLPELEKAEVQRRCARYLGGGS